MKKAFPPIVSPHSQILVLGTMPGEESLRRQQYYGHPNNQFWPIMFALFEEPLTDDYQKRINLLHEKRIALWDVLASCEGKGSADSDIRNEKANNFSSFFASYPHIRHVFFASKKAESFFNEYVGKQEGFAYTTLPSPSPANARMSLPQKIEAWQVILKSL
ncbi:hypoxanthine-DNA glycosylase [Dysgonomonas sp. PH5-45]|uniref:DNA-deoxyinosine glycosylase n=1 Tax=unclassified Dysgonomonas TaxID=2630389 RepID=UPI002473D17F|nr:MULTISPECIES: DNA-deoxyinosine glycosylase [unclassified Dysgonomonas]MDH6353784.1 hypoxanthine-DNA glycosylase [Dysgonomonas sp. PH5-45]MDH6386686.1 hypoxanthine-DNA glycosylase [Dysgonomonas sp. PH5-37]